VRNLVDICAGVDSDSCDVEIDKDAKIVEISDFARVGGMASSVAKKTGVVGNGEG
jgi:hypothetical protein